MIIVERVLSVGMSGDDVRTLHEQLELLHFFVPPGERAFRFFGPVTRKAVMEVQRERLHPSRVNGLVDQATANIIREEARWGP